MAESKEKKTRATKAKASTNDVNEAVAEEIQVSPEAETAPVNTTRTRKAKVAEKEVEDTVDDATNEAAEESVKAPKTKKATKAKRTAKVEEEDADLVEDEDDADMEEVAKPKAAQTSRRGKKQLLPAVTRKELAYKVQKMIEVKPPIAKKIVNIFFDTIRENLLNSRTVKLTTFGTFSVVQKNARPGRNIRTGETVMIQPRKVVRFRPSRRLRWEP